MHIRASSGRLRATVLLALLTGMAGLLVPLGCGGGSGEELTGQPEIPALAACANAGASVPRPDGLPDDFPLPPGTVLTSSATPYPGQVLIGGVIPAELGDAANFFGAALPDAGYEVGRGDSEQGESEAPFTGNGVRGKWKVNGLDDCPSAVTLTLVVIEQ